LHSEGGIGAFLRFESGVQMAREKRAQKH
jgi:hypothetical protein